MWVEGLNGLDSCRSGRNPSARHQPRRPVCPVPKRGERCPSRRGYRLSIGLAPGHRNHDNYFLHSLLGYSRTVSHPGIISDNLFQPCPPGATTTILSPVRRLMAEMVELGWEPWAVFTLSPISWQRTHPAVGSTIHIGTRISNGRYYLHRLAAIYRHLDNAPESVEYRAYFSSGVKHMLTQSWGKSQLSELVRSLRPVALRYQIVIPQISSGRTQCPTDGIREERFHRSGFQVQACRAHMGGRLHSISLYGYRRRNCLRTVEIQAPSIGRKPDEPVNRFPHRQLPAVVRIEVNAVVHHSGVPPFAGTRKIKLRSEYAIYSHPGTIPEIPGGNPPSFLDPPVA